MNVKIDARAFRVAMAEKNMSQRDLIAASGISGFTIARMVRGEPFTSSTLAAIADALEVDPRELLDVTRETVAA